MNKTGAIFVSLGAFNAALAVALGAVASHVLRGRLSAGMMDIYHVGNQFQIYHALGLILIGLAVMQMPGSSALRWAGWMMLAGILIFCGALYVLSLTGWTWAAYFAPFGGTAFILAWVLLGIGAWPRGGS